MAMFPPIMTAVAAAPEPLPPLKANVGGVPPGVQTPAYVTTTLVTGLGDVPIVAISVGSVVQDPLEAVTVGAVVYPEPPAVNVAE